MDGGGGEIHPEFAARRMAWGRADLSDRDRALACRERQRSANAFVQVRSRLFAGGEWIRTSSSAREELSRLAESWPVLRRVEQTDAEKRRSFDAGAPGQSLHHLIMQSLLAASEAAQVVAQESPSHCLHNAESRRRRAEMSTCVISRARTRRQRLLCGHVDAACDVAPRCYRRGVTCSLSLRAKVR
jgi:hypothetical protein